MSRVKFFILSCFIVSPVIVNAFDIKISNNTGKDLKTVAFYDNGSIVRGDACIEPNGLSSSIDIPNSLAENGKISAAFIKIYSSSNGTCVMQSSKVGASNVISFSADDLNMNSQVLHYHSVTSSGLNMTPIIIFNSAMKAISSYTGYRQGDKDKNSYTYYSGSKPDELLSQTDPLGYNKDIYVESGQMLKLY